MTPLRTTVIGSYPFPGWLEHAAANLGSFAADDTVGSGVKRLAVTRR